MDKPKLSVIPMPNTSKFLLVTDEDWPIAEIYTEHDANSLCVANNASPAAEQMYKALKAFEARGPVPEVFDMCLAAIANYEAQKK